MGHIKRVLTGWDPDSLETEVSEQIVEIPKPPTVMSYLKTRIISTRNQKPCNQCGKPMYPEKFNTTVAIYRCRRNCSAHNRPQGCIPLAVLSGKVKADGKG